MKMNFKISVALLSLSLISNTFALSTYPTKPIAASKSAIMQKSNKQIITTKPHYFVAPKTRLPKKASFPSAKVVNNGIFNFLYG